MKILFFLEDYYLGGVDTFVINLINNWPNGNDHLTLICNYQHTGLEFIRKSTTRQCSIITHRITIFTSFFELTKNKTMDKILKVFFKFSSPITRYAFFLYNIFAFKKMFTQNNADRLMIINGGYPGGDSCRAASIAWGVLNKKNLCFHNFHGIVAKPSLHIAMQEYIVDKFVSRYTKMFITVSQTASNSMPVRNSVFSKLVIPYIYNGISLNSKENMTNLSNIKAELNLTPESKICLMMGGYHQHKNFDKGHSFLFTSFKRVIERIPYAHLLICGYGSKKDINRVNNLIKKYELENKAHLFGFRKDILSILYFTDVLLISSQATESFSFAAIEAMAHKIPIVSTNIGALPEIISDQEGGYVVNKEDFESFAEIIINLLSNNRLRNEQGKKGFLRFQQYFTASRMAAEYAKLIHNG